MYFIGMYFKPIQILFTPCPNTIECNAHLPMPRHISPRASPARLLLNVFICQLSSCAFVCPSPALLPFHSQPPPMKFYCNAVYF